MSIAKKRNDARNSRKARVRKKVKGTEQSPRLCVFRSSRFTYAQLISDDTGSVLASASSRNIAADGKSTKSVDSAKAVGVKIAELAKEKNIEQVVFDRNGYLYHGRVAAVANGAREGGLKL